MGARAPDPELLPPPWRHEEPTSDLQGDTAIVPNLSERVNFSPPDQFLLITNRVNDALIGRLAARPEVLRSEQIDSRLLEEIVAEL